MIVAYHTTAFHIETGDEVLEPDKSGYMTFTLDKPTIPGNYAYSMDAKTLIDNYEGIVSPDRTPASALSGEEAWHAIQTDRTLFILVQKPIPATKVLRFFKVVKASE